MSALINKFANLIGIESSEQEEEITDGNIVETAKETNNNIQREEKVMRFNDIKNKGIFIERFNKFFEIVGYLSNVHVG